MFRRPERLSREEIAEVTRSGLSVHTPYFSLRVIDRPNTLVNKANPPARQAKLAFVMSKKEEKTAPGRNRAKRRLRGAFREHYPLLKPCFIMVFIKKAALRAPYNDIREALHGALKKIN